MIKRLNSDYSNVGVVYDEAQQEKISYCSTCMAVGELSRLRERIWLDSKGKRLPDPPNADNWLMCWRCGLIIAVKDIKLSGKIKGIQGIETIDNPYDQKKGIILGIDSKHRYQRLKNRKTKHPDAEVQRLLDQGYELKSYESYTPEPVNQ